MTVRIYLDAAPVIYTVEQVALYAAAVDARLSTPGVVCLTSDLTRMECRVKPLTDKDDALRLAQLCLLGRSVHSTHRSPRLHSRSSSPAATDGETV
jgi:hypothetical protein